MVDKSSGTILLPYLVMKFLASYKRFYKLKEGYDDALNPEFMIFGKMSLNVRC